MGLAAPEQVTTVHWTRFPASALADVDWSDHHDAHRAIMRLFPRLLDGPPSERRAANGILYRVDVLAGEAVVLIQSAVVPQMLPVGARTMIVPERAWTFRTGDRIAFRVAVNPVRRRTVRPEGAAPAVTGEQRDRTGQRDTVVGAVAVNDMPTWLTAKMSDAVTDLEVVSHFRDETGHGPQKVIIDTLDCIATVANTHTLGALRQQGIGRAKAYGCGLLTAQRALD